MLNWERESVAVCGKNDRSDEIRKLSPEAYKVLEQVRRYGPVHLESLKSMELSNQLAEVLLQLEMTGLIRTLPGPVYEC